MALSLESPFRHNHEQKALTFHDIHGQEIQDAADTYGQPAKSSHIVPTCDNRSVRSTGGIITGKEDS